MRVAFCLVLSILILVPSKSLRAQIAGSGAIQGRIVDPTGAVIPDTTVTALETETGVSTVRKSSSVPSR